MNYLIHCWLGRHDPGLQAGGFLGDFIKGNLGDDIPAELKRGLKLHRYIDMQSNHLTSMKSTYGRFGTELRRPAPVLLDLVADHVFAKHWSEFADGDLESFTQECYEVIGSYKVPASASRLYEHMCATDLFARYAHLSVVEDIMARILKRLRMDHLKAQLAKVLRDEGNGFKSDFETYFPELEQMAAQWRKAASVE